MYINDKDFETLIVQYSRLIFTICFSITKDRLDSEDLTQETFLSAYKQHTKVREENLKAWLSKIALNKCRDYLRKNKLQAFKLPFDEDTLIIKTNLSMEEEAAGNEEYRHIKTIILSLNEPYRSAAYYYYIEGIPLAQYCADINVPLKTLQTRIRRAKKMILIKYKEVYGDDYI